MTQNGNAIFLWDTADLGSATITVDPPAAEDSDWPVENVDDTFRSLAAKFTTGATIKIDFGTAPYITAVGLVDLAGLDPETIITITAYEDAFITPAVTHTFTAGLPMLLWGDGFWGDGIWGGYADEDDLYGNQPRLELIASGEAAYRYWAMDVDTTSAWSLGRLIFGDYFQPEHNLSWGWSHEPIDLTTVVETPTGVKLSDIGPLVNGVSIKLDVLTSGEAFGPLAAMHRKVGKHRDMILMVAPDEDTIRPATTIYGRFETDLGTNNFAIGWHRMSADLKFRENL